MTPRSFEEDAPGDLNWAELLGVQVLNALALVLLVLFWPALAASRGLAKLLNAAQRAHTARQLLRARRPVGAST